MCFGQTGHGEILSDSPSVVAVRLLTESFGTSLKKISSRVRMGTASLSPLNNGTLGRATLLSPRLAVPGSLLCRLYGPLHLPPSRSPLLSPLVWCASRKKPHTRSLSLSLLLFVCLSLSLLFLLRSPGGLGLDVPHRRRRVAFPSTYCTSSPRVSIGDRRSSDSFFFSRGGLRRIVVRYIYGRTRRSGVSAKTSGFGGSTSEGSGHPALRDDQRELRRF